MKRKLSLLFPLVLFVLMLSACQNKELTPPNVLILLADDLGFSDAGCYGGEILTPNLDQLADAGLRYTQFYNTARCWPTRAAILTGYYPQQSGRDNAPGIKGGGGSPRAAWAKVIPHYLEGTAYRTYHSGKWHVDGKPVENGFDLSYWLPDHNRFFSPARHFENDIPLEAVPRGTSYYSTSEIASRAISQLKTHSEESGDQPFFSYVAFTTPHFPLHAPAEDIAAVGDRYVSGWDQMRAQRWERIQEMGIASGTLSPVEAEVGPPYHFPESLEILGENEVNRPLPWKSLSAEQQVFQQQKMSIHAAMVERLDKEIGRIVEQLREMGAYDNTLIFFLSDNGCSAEIMVRGDGHDPEADPGSADSYLCLGPGWSTMCNTPFRMHKTWVHEGGACTPLIVHWPSGIKARGELRSNPGHVIDLLPTVLDLAGVDVSATLEVPFPGESLVPTFEGESEWGRELWWYHEGNRALRHGDWKIVAAREKPWELFNLGSDRTESENLAESSPEKVKELETRWESILADIREVAPVKDDAAHEVPVTDH